ncbi:non-specific lipid-transfer AP10-like [Olea europaea subsp. europaea]|uniref:Non-specific lipid-transfer protein n=1 Tax=Olea europaea subsp. europaea TaxID=158383 RepID=A0A8S0Q234_OLEEU|nr:non-specific lipid-transfer AP10-like [Olea europaea subsp. europaea]
MEPGSNTYLPGLVILALISFSPIDPVNAISCTQALTDLLPCQAFLIGMGDVTVPCCQGVQALIQIVSSQADRKSVCVCLKQAAFSANVNQERVKELPQLCKIDVPKPFQPDGECNMYDSIERKVMWAETLTEG